VAFVSIISPAQSVALKLSAPESIKLTHNFAFPLHSSGNSQVDIGDLIDCSFQLWRCIVYLPDFLNLIEMWRNIRNTQKAKTYHRLTKIQEGQLLGISFAKESLFRLEQAGIDQISKGKGVWRELFSQHQSKISFKTPASMPSDPPEAKKSEWYWIQAGLRNRIRDIQRKLDFAGEFVQKSNRALRFYKMGFLAKD